MKMLLTSRGLTKDIFISFERFLTKNPNKYKVAFINTAAYCENPKESFLKFVKPYLVNCFAKLNLISFGFVNISTIDLRNENILSLKEKIKDKDIIFVNGVF